MLSHLVGAANRADIRRLRELESENVALQEKVARQQSQLRDAIIRRDATIAGLNEMLGKAIDSAQHASRITTERADEIEQQTMAQLIGELRRRLAVEVASREKMERRLGTVSAERDTERQQRRLSDEREHELRRELELIELSLSSQLPTRDGEDEPAIDLRGTILLYVGGRAHQIPQLRALAERSGASFLHHDGGMKIAAVCSRHRLPGQISCSFRSTVCPQRRGDGEADGSLYGQTVCGVTKLRIDLACCRCPCSKI